MSILRGNQGRCITVMILNCLIVFFCDFFVKSIDAKTRTGWGSALFYQPYVGVAMTARQAFSREETTWWQHVCKILRRKKDPQGLLKKKNPGVMFQRTADAPSEAAMSEGAPLLLPAAHIHRSIESANHMVWRSYFQSRTNDFHRPCVVSGWILFALWM